jgi:hypothetical protein
MSGGAWSQPPQAPSAAEILEGVGGPFSRPVWVIRCSANATCIMKREFTSSNEALPAMDSPENELEPSRTSETTNPGL